jgi:hypothetical protein
MPIEYFSFIQIFLDRRNRCIHLGNLEHSKIQIIVRTSGRHYRLKLQLIQVWKLMSCQQILPHIEYVYTFGLFLTLSFSLDRLAKQASPPRTGVWNLPFERSKADKALTLTSRDCRSTRSTETTQVTYCAGTTSAKQKAETRSRFNRNKLPHFV